MKLDLTLTTADERSEYIQNYFTQNPSFTPTQSQIELISNYLLFGKQPLNKYNEPTQDPSKFTNPTQRKEIQIKTRYDSWTKKQPLSLEEILECPSFNESSIPLHPIQARTPKPNFSRSLNVQIPNIHELWNTIDYYTDKLQDPTLSSLHKYKLRHMIIEMRREQFTLRDSFIATPLLHKGRSGAPIYEDIDTKILEGDYSFAPMGLYKKGDLRFEDPLKLANELDNFQFNARAHHIIDFSNIDDLQRLLSNYIELEMLVENNPLSSQKLILDTLNYYIENTKLTNSQRLVITLKARSLSNQDIVEIVNRECGKNYRSNYISTIYGQACARVCEQVNQIYITYYERINPENFKRCNCCKKDKIRNTFNFTRKTRNSDGLSNKCKECENTHVKE